MLRAQEPPHGPIYGGRMLRGFFPTQDALSVVIGFEVTL